MVTASKANEKAFPTSQGHVAQRTIAMKAEEAKATAVSMESGMHAYGISDRRATSHSRAPAAPDATNTPIGAIDGQATPRIAAKRPSPHATGNRGAHAMFAPGDMSGSWENSEQEYSWESRHALTVRESGPDINGMRQRGVFETRYSTNGENRTIPHVERAESANDAESDEAGLMLTKAIIPIPSAFIDDDRRLAMNDVSPSADIATALSADTGIPATTR